MAEFAIRRRRVVPDTHDEAMFAKFIQPPAEPSRTLDRVPADVFFRRKVGDGIDIQLPYRLPDGKDKLRMWVVGNPDGARTFPSEAIRVRVGQTVNVEATTSIGPHTIHWHGVEGSPMNDGVGKHSFEIRSRYTYQFTPRDPGFFFYHCHRNTPLHFEMGLYGALIIDPPQGPGYVSALSPATDNVVAYQSEVFWVCGAQDPRWHGFSHNHAIGSPDPNDPKSFTTGGGLGDWKPTVFNITGAVAKDGATVITDPRAMGRAAVGQTVLVRLLNASYAIQEYRIGADALVIAQDGRALGVPPYGAYSEPFTIPAGKPFQLTSAMRHDILVRPTAPGVIPFQVDYWDWQGATLRGRAKTQIVVA
jgi:FtsP/CotA-like multicopper oxidase with cupredoxin domain